MPGVVLMETPSISEGYKAPEPTTLTVKQKYWSWFKRSGRGFAVTQPDGSIVFVAGSKTMGKHRVIEDKHGKALFDLERNWTSKEKAWILSVGKDVLFTVGYSWLHKLISMKVAFDGHEIVVKGSDRWGEILEIISDGTTIATMRCTNMKSGIASHLKVSPPTWEVGVTEGTDMALITALAICVSDAFSESRALML